MRRAALCATAIAALACILSAADLLDGSRAAVAGGRMLPAIHSVKMTGRLRTAPASGVNDAMADGTVDIRIQLPQRYIRVDVVGSTRRVTGCDGGRVLTPGPGRDADRLKLERAQLTRLMLGSAAIVVSDEAVKMEPVGEEAFPDTRTVDMTAKSWSLRFVVDAATAMPMRLVFFGAARGTTITSFADRREVAGYLLPHRITTTTSERVLETLMFDDIVVNPPLTEADFRRR